MRIVFLSLLSLQCSSSSSNSQYQASSNTSESRILPLPIMHMYRPPDQHLYEGQQSLLKQLAQGYQFICQQYPQPNKFAHRNAFIAQTTNMESKLILVKELTRELTQMTTSRLLYYFSLIPEFKLLMESEQKSIMIKNMLAVFMFHGALTYDAQNDTFVDKITGNFSSYTSISNRFFSPNLYSRSTIRCEIPSIRLRSKSLQ